jgi:hypothetical protein
MVNHKQTLSPYLVLAKDVAGCPQNIAARPNRGLLD